MTVAQAGLGIIAVAENEADLGLAGSFRSRNSLIDCVVGFVAHLDLPLFDNFYFKTGVVVESGQNDDVEVGGIGQQ